MWRGLFGAYVGLYVVLPSSRGKSTISRCIGDNTAGLAGIGHVSGGGGTGSRRHGIRLNYEAEYSWYMVRGGDADRHVGDD